MQNYPLTPLDIFGYLSLAVAKSTASRRKLIISSQANSTPNRAFFVRSFRSPQKSGLCRLFSMVGRNRHAYAWLLSCDGSFPTLLRSTAKTVGSLAVVHKQIFTGLSAMIYQFLCVNRNQKPYLEEIVQVQAINEDEARWQLTAEHALLLTVGRYPDNATAEATDRTARLNARLLAKFRPNLTACQGGIYA